MGTQLTLQQLVGEFGEPAVARAAGKHFTQVLAGAKNDEAPIPFVPTTPKAKRGRPAKTAKPKGERRARTSKEDVAAQLEQVWQKCQSLDTVITRAEVVNQTKLPEVVVGRMLGKLVAEKKLTKSGERSNTTYAVA